MAVLINEECREFDAYLNTAVEAAQRRKIADCNYFLRQAAVSAQRLGWEQNRERLLAVVAECNATLEAE